MKKVNKKQKNNNSYLKKILFIVVFISVVVQVNIAITDSIKGFLKQQKIEKETMLCPPDCCKLANDEDYYQVPELPEIEVLDVNVKPIK